MRVLHIYNLFDCPCYCLVVFFYYFISFTYYLSTGWLLWSNKQFINFCAFIYILMLLYMFVQINARTVHSFSIDFFHSIFIRLGLFFLILLFIYNMFVYMYVILLCLLLAYIFFPCEFIYYFYDHFHQAEMLSLYCHIQLEISLNTNYPFRLKKKTLER